ncbi:MAG: hypothetical protein KGI49_03540 [Patescibacteria group bacterium]|nr:hypothetical protein [Patescibacteria group bacterium]
MAKAELELEGYRCTFIDGRWLEFKVTLRGDHSFLMYFGLSRKVLSHCRKLCSKGKSRRFVHGVTISVKETVEEIGRRISNCIMSVRAAFFCGNRRVFHRHDDEEFESGQHIAALPERPMFRTGMSFMTAT